MNTLVEVAGWRWSQVITFKYDENTHNWLLSKVGSDYWYIDNPSKFQNIQFTKRDFGVVSFIDYKNDWTKK